MFHCQVKNGLTFMCMTDANAQKKIAFAFLDDIARRWSTMYGSSNIAISHFSKQQQFGPVLEAQIVMQQCIEYIFDTPTHILL